MNLEFTLSLIFDRKFMRPLHNQYTVSTCCEIRSSDRCSKNAFYHIGVQKFVVTGFFFVGLSIATTKKRFNVTAGPTSGLPLNFTKK